MSERRCQSNHLTVLQPSLHHTDQPSSQPPMCWTTASRLPCRLPASWLQMVSRLQVTSGIYRKVLSYCTDNPYMREFFEADIVFSHAVFTVIYQRTMIIQLPFDSQCPVILILVGQAKTFPKPHGTSGCTSIMTCPRGFWKRCFYGVDAFIGIPEGD